MQDLLAHSSYCVLKESVAISFVDTQTKVLVPKQVAKYKPELLHSESIHCIPYTVASIKLNKLKLKT